MPHIEDQVSGRTGRHVKGHRQPMSSWTSFNYGGLLWVIYMSRKRLPGSGRNGCLAKQPKGSGCIARRECQQQPVVLSDTTKY